MMRRLPSHAPMMAGVVTAALLGGCHLYFGDGDDAAAGPTPDAAIGPTPDAALPDAGVPPLAPVFAQTAYLKSTAPMTEKRFGQPALSGAGDRLVATQSGTVNVYARDPSWRVDATLTSPTLDFGSRVAISNDGSTIAIGASPALPFSIIGRIFVNRRVNGLWQHEGNIDDGGGNGAIALTSGGTILAVRSQSSETDGGRVRMYERGANGWGHIASVEAEPGESFGQELVLAQDGSTLVVSVYRSGNKVGVFKRAGNTWLRKATLASTAAQPVEQFGWYLACSATCNTIAVGTVYSGAFVFSGDGTTWTPKAHLVVDGQIGDHFGRSVALSGDGETLVVGAPGESGGGTGIGIDDGINTVANSGAAYVFRLHNGAWWEVMYMKASNAEFNDQFGSTLSVSNDGKAIAIAAWHENGGASGVNGDQADNSQPYAGAAYVFEGTYPIAED